ncbi:hypothetical protein XALC_2404 [Xanthomonas albilineans GPE PC73]|uniref:Uncharacterized protein n=1 Tax=Xanthomonas albilineans (strain GPE PC73 / CFBP 7063) TaxID=380358 RepID=D2U9E2_XANAP|nr:hypothetical protein XALC_2404 [Xanthomonas albilineans GPE PC73]
MVLAVILETAQNTHSEDHDSQHTKHGVFGDGSANFTIGKQLIRTDATSKTLTHTDSTVGSQAKGDARMQALAVASAAYSAYGGASLGNAL